MHQKRWLINVPKEYGCTNTRDQIKQFKEFLGTINLQKSAFWTVLRLHKRCKTWRDQLFRTLYGNIFKWQKEYPWDFRNIIFSRTKLWQPKQDSLANHDREVLDCQQLLHWKWVCIWYNPQKAVATLLSHLSWVFGKWKPLEKPVIIPIYQE